MTLVKSDVGGNISVTIPGYQRHARLMRNFYVLSKIPLFSHVVPCHVIQCGGM